MDGDNGSTLSIEELAAVRRELAESKSLLEQHSKTISDLSNEKATLESKKTDLEIRLNTLEVEYEELLDKTIAEEENAEDRTVDIAETVSNLKVSYERLITMSTVHAYLHFLLSSSSLNHNTPLRKSCKRKKLSNSSKKWRERMLISISLVVL